MLTFLNPALQYATAMLERLPTEQVTAMGLSFAETQFFWQVCEENSISTFYDAFIFPFAWFANI